jgi:hypothetical protein
VADGAAENMAAQQIFVIVWLHCSMVGYAGGRRE